MATYCILFALLFVGGLALPEQDEGPGFDKKLSAFFDHTVKNPITTFSLDTVNAGIAPEGSFPWMVAMINGVYKTYMCGGSIISNRHVLTAAHCIAAVSYGTTLSSTLGVTVGTNVWNAGGKTYGLKSFEINSLYNPMSLKNDIGILVTSSVIAMNSRVSAIPLDTSFVSADVAAKSCGWGARPTGGATSLQLLQVKTKTMDGAKCVADVAKSNEKSPNQTPNVDADIELCTAAESAQSICTGDGGAALVRESNKQIGIVSWGQECVTGAINVYTRVSAYNDWITDAISAAV